MSTVLDWRHPSHWNGGRRKPCRICGERTFLLDEHGVPCHKTCAEAEADRPVRGKP